MRHQPNVPYGYCHCGCGQKTRLAPYSSRRLGWVKGEPIRYILGHQSRLPPRAPDVSDYAIDSQTGCWVWQHGHSDTGYGNVHSSGRIMNAHRWYYEQHVGPIPPGLQIDHLCRNRACVNPAHLDLVTPAENVRRAAALITHCPRGHEYTPENTYHRPGPVAGRMCNECRRQKQREAYARNREAVNARKRARYHAKRAIENRSNR